MAIEAPAKVPPHIVLRVVGAAAVVAEFDERAARQRYGRTASELAVRGGLGQRSRAGGRRLRGGRGLTRSCRRASRRGGGCRLGRGTRRRRRLSRHSHPRSRHRSCWLVYVMITHAGLTTARDHERSQRCSNRGCAYDGAYGNPPHMVGDSSPNAWKSVRNGGFWFVAEEKST